MRVLLLLLTALLFAGCTAPPQAAAGPEAGAPGEPALRIVTTVSPITNIAYNIAGDKALISGVVPEGVNSHTFEPAPSDAKVLAEADLIFANGLKLEEPTLDLAQANLKTGAAIVLLGDQTITPDQYVYDFSFPKDAGSPNPHLWPNPAFALRYAEIMRDALGRSFDRPIQLNNLEDGYDKVIARAFHKGRFIRVSAGNHVDEIDSELAFPGSFRQRNGQQP